MGSATVLLSWCILACGVTAFINSVDHNRMRRVFNGEEVVRHSKPWMGLMTENSTVHCSSFLISRQHGLAGDNYDKSSDVALTAAHCVYDESRNAIRSANYSIIFGKHKRQVDEPDNFRVDVQSIYVHPGYLRVENGTNKRNHSNDIAVLHLKYSVAYDDHTKPLPLSNVKDKLATEDCVVSGWGPHRSISRHMCRLALSTIRFDKIGFDIVKDFYIGIPFRGQEIILGDSGSPVVCTLGEQTFAQGIVAATFKNKSVVLANIPWKMQWIVDIIDGTKKAPVFTPIIASYEKNGNVFHADWPLLVDHLKYLLTGMFGIIPTDFNRNISNTTSDWNLTKTGVIRKVTEIHKGFCLGNVFGLASVDNVTDCAIRCYNQNPDGFCNYLSSAQRCYFSKNLMNIFATEISICLYFYHGRIKDKLVKSKTLMNGLKEYIDDRSAKWSIQYEVALHGNKWTNFYCHAILESTDGGQYNMIRVSYECLQKLWNKTSSMTSFGLIAVFDTHSVYVKLESTTFVVDSEKSWAIGHLINQVITVPKNYPQKTLLDFSSPFRMMFWPFGGAFLSDPLTMPWIVQIFKPNEDSDDQFICTGVLLDENDIEPDSSIYQSRFVLASTSCKLDLEYEYYALVGSQFKNITGALQTKAEIQNYFIIEGDSDKKSFMVIMLKSSVHFNQLAQPIRLPSNDEVQLNKSDFFIAAFSPMMSNMWAYNAITEIPISISLNKTIVIEKIYRKSGNLDDMNNGDPIIGCSRSNGRCVIHGLFWCKGKMGSYDEYSIAIYQHTENIRKAVKTAIKYDAELSAISQSFITLL